MKIKIEKATPDLASHIASFIMEAMNAECCQNFAGPKHTLIDFHRMMTRLVEMEDSQYSYRNTLAAFTSNGILVGACVGYDGADLRRLRRRFCEEALVEFGLDYSGMPDETEEVSFISTASPCRGTSVARVLPPNSSRLPSSVPRSCDCQLSACWSIRATPKLRLSILALVSST